MTKIDWNFYRDFKNDEKEKSEYVLDESGDWDDFSDEFHLANDWLNEMEGRLQKGEAIKDMYIDALQAALGRSHLEAITPRSWELIDKWEHFDELKEADQQAFDKSR